MTEEQLEGFKKSMDCKLDLPTEKQLKNFNNLLRSFTESTSKEDKEFCKEVDEFLTATELFHHLLKPNYNSWG